MGFRTVANSIKNDHKYRGAASFRLRNDPIRLETSTAYSLSFIQRPCATSLFRRGEPLQLHADNDSISERT